jgi:colanic acid biosynthesis glycosyl transferase WcaI
VTFEIIPLASHHTQQVVQVHLAAFPNFFLTFLGPRFLKEFYNSFTVDSAGIGFVAQESQTKEIYGVIVGPFNPAGYFRRLLKRRWWAFCVASLTAILKKPSVIKRLFRAVFYRGDTPAKVVGLALLSSIAVSPDIQAQGLGSSLVHAFIEEIKQRGGRGVFFTTDAEGNDKVNHFYEKIGFLLESCYATPEGRQMNRYVLMFNDDKSQLSG